MHHVPEPVLSVLTQLVVIHFSAMVISLVTFPISDNGFVTTPLVSVSSLKRQIPWKVNDALLLISALPFALGITAFLPAEG